MARIIANRTIGAALLRHGLVPADCYNAEILIRVDGAMAIRYEVMVSPEHLQKLSDVFAEVAAGKAIEGQ